MHRNGNFDELGKKIVELAGSAENIRSVTNCATRVRLKLVDDSKADLDAIKGLDGVMGALFNIGQLQVVIGSEVAEVVAAVNKACKEADGMGEGKRGEKSGGMSPEGDHKNSTWRAGRLFIDFLSASIRPVVPVFFGGGMIKVYISLVNLVMPGFSDSQTALLLGFVANVPFHFLPVLFAYGVATYYGTSPIYPMTVALGLMYPSFAAAVKDGAALSLFGLPVPLIDYSSKIIPTMLTSVLAHYVEMGMIRITPKTLRNPIVGPVTIAVTYAAGLLVLGPFGTLLTNAISAITAWCSTYISFITMPLIAATLPFLVLTGLGSAFLPLMSQAMEDPGYDALFRPALTLHNMAEGASAFGIALKTKNTDLKSACCSIGVGGIIAGVSEPSIFGLDLPYKTPMYAVMAGGATGGIVASIMGVKAYVMGYSTILALPIYEDTVIGMVVAIAVSIAVAGIASFILWDDKCLDGNPFTGNMY